MEIVKFQTFLPFKIPVIFSENLAKCVLIEHRNGSRSLFFNFLKIDIFLNFDLDISSRPHCATIIKSAPSALLSLCSGVVKRRTETFIFMSKCLVKLGEVGLPFCWLALDLRLDWEISGDFHIYVTNPEVALFSFLMSWCWFCAGFHCFLWNWPRVNTQDKAQSGLWEKFARFYKVILGIYNQFLTQNLFSIQVPE